MEEYTERLEILELEEGSYHILLHVRINEVEGDVIIDTGASMSVFDKDIFAGMEVYECPESRESGSVTGSITDVKLYKAAHICLGETDIGEQVVAAIDLSYVNEIYERQKGRKIIGLLGCDFFVAHKAIIDYKKSQLTYQKSVQNNI